MSQNVGCNASPRQIESYKRKSHGFTLIEILVALLIFAIIGVISSQLLSQTINSHNTLKQRGERLGDVHRAMQIIQRDLMQIAARPIKNEFRDDEAALTIDTDGTIEFSRSGWRNPLGLPRAQVQRVAYLLDDNKLVRAYWHVLDRAPDSEPAQQILLEDVDRLEFFVVDENGNEHTFWGVPGAAPVPMSGIIVRLELAPFGEIERVWEVPNV